MKQENLAGKDEAKSRIAKALDLIEQAQGMLGEACGLLSRVLGSEDHWDHVVKGYDDVHNLWRRVNENTAARDYGMDSDWKQRREHDDETKG